VSDTVTYTVPDMSCEHCRAAIAEGLTGAAGVESVDVDLDAKLVTVTGGQLDDAILRAAIFEAGYEAS
jgi:copper chaperone